MAIGKSQVGTTTVTVRRVILPNPVIHLNGKVTVFQRLGAFINEHERLRRRRINDTGILPADGIARIDPIDVAIHLAGH